MRIFYILVASGVIAVAQFARAADLSLASTEPMVRFDRSFLSSQDRADITLFEYSNVFPPGNHPLDVYLENRKIGSYNVSFSIVDGKRTAPCFPREIFRHLGLREEVLARIDETGKACLMGSDLPALIDFESDVSEQRVTFHVAQTELEVLPVGYTNPAEWSNGVNAGFVTYHMNLSRMTGSADVKSAFLATTEGLNLDGWDLRGDSVYSGASRSRGQFTQQDAFLTHDVDLLRGRAYIGKYVTDGALFAGVGMRGANLRSDDLMLPESQRGFAPVVRGIARSNALVTISQAGRIVTQQNVPPGPFEIQNLFSVSTGAPLHVVVTEADGSQTFFEVASSVVPRLLRKAISQYSFSLGQLDDSLVTSHPVFGEASFLHGFSDQVTGYAGTQFSGAYRAILGGLSVSTPVGAVSVDDTVTQSHVRASDIYGNSLHALYDVYLSYTGTSFFASYDRYSGSGYFDLRQVEAAAHPSSVVSLYPFDPYNPLQLLSGRWQAGLTQTIPGHGTLYATVISQRLRNAGQWLPSYQVTYTDRFCNIGYAIGFSRQQSLGTGASYNLASLSLTIPLGSKATLTSQLTHSRQEDQQSLGVNGQFMAGTTAGGYGISVAHDRAGTVGYVNGSAVLPAAQVSAYFSDGAGYTQQAVNVSGSVIGFNGGVEASPPVDNTFAIVKAKSVPGAQVASVANTRIGGDGLAVIPYLQPYAENLVTLDPEGTNSNIELRETQKTVIPRSGSIQLVEFESEPGQPLLIHFNGAPGKPVPFGAEVTDESDRRVGFVGSDGLAYVRVLGDSGTLLVRDDAGLVCAAPYSLSATDAVTSGFRQITVECQK